MNRISTWLVFLLLWIYSGALAQKLEYKISPLWEENSMRLQVDMTWNSEGSSQQTIKLPTEYGSAKQLQSCYTNIRLTAGNGFLRYNANTAEIIIKCSPNTSFTLSYEISQRIVGEEPTLEQAFYPIVNHRYFQVLGHSLFLIPQDFLGGKAEVFWENFPDYWTLHNSFGSRKKAQTISLSRSDLFNAIYIGGDFRIQTTEINGKTIHLAIRGYDWQFSDSELLLTLKNTVEAQRNFWNDHEIPYYTIIVTPLKMENQYTQAQNIQYVGTGLANSFAAYVRPSVSTGLSDLLHLFHHELMHDWIGQKIKIKGEKMNDMSNAWFMEGFTEYFALLNMLQGEFISEEKYNSMLNNDYFLQLYHSPYGTLNNQSVASGFFKDKSIAEVPYKRGFVFAFYLDQELMKQSKGTYNLQDVMVSLLDYCYESNRSLDKDFSQFLQIVESKLGSRIRGEYERFIIKGDLIPVEHFSSLVCFSVDANATFCPRFLKRTDSTYCK